MKVASEISGDDVQGLSELLGRSYTWAECALVLRPTLARMLTVASSEAVAQAFAYLLEHRAEWPESRFDRPDPSRLPTPAGRM